MKRTMPRTASESTCDQKARKTMKWPAAQPREDAIKRGRRPYAEEEEEEDE
jgi:hypothetical protein